MELEEFKRSEECTVLENVFQYIDPQIVQDVFMNVEKDVYARMRDSLECMLMLDYNIQTVFPYNADADFSAHPLCLAHYQAYVLTNSVQSALQKAPVLEKKI